MSPSDNEESKQKASETVKSELLQKDSEQAQKADLGAITNFSTHTFWKGGGGENNEGRIRGRDRKGKGKEGLTMNEQKKAFST